VIGTDVTAPPNRIARLRDRFARWAAAVPWARVIQWPAVIVFFTVAAVVQTWPLVQELDNGVNTWSFFPYDTWAFLWDLWWVKHALVELQTNPFHTDHLLYPQGSNLYLHPVTFVNGLLSIPLQLITGNLILTWNILSIVFLVLSGVGAYALAYRVTRNHLAGVFAGYVFAFTPFIFMRLGGHFNVYTTWPIPFLLLFLIRFHEERRLRDAAIAGVLWAVLTYNWLEFATDAGLVMVLFFLYWIAVELLRRDKERLISLVRGGAVLAAVWIVISIPLLYPTWRDNNSGRFFQPGGDESFSADLLSYITPSPLWGEGVNLSWAASWPDLPLGGDTGDQPVAYSRHPAHQAHVGSIEGTTYLGILPLVLGVVALARLRRNPHQVLPWLIGFLFFAVLALGPKLWIDDSTEFSLLGISFSVPLPYQIYNELPLLGNRRVPARMIVLGIMALSVLAAIGLDVLMASSKRWLGRGTLALGVAAIAIVGLEFWNPPLPLIPYTNSEVLEQIRSDSGDFNVLHAPLGRRTGWTCSGDCTGAALVNYYQTLHEKPSFGGYVSRVSDEEFSWFLEQPGLSYLSRTGFVDPPTGDDADPEKVRATFEENRIKYVIVHKLGPEGGGISYVGQGEIDKMDRYIQDIAGFEPFYSDPQLSVYRMPEEARDGERR
jgi:hypothetical protein